MILCKLSTFLLILSLNSCISIDSSTPENRTRVVVPETVLPAKFHTDETLVPSAIQVPIAMVSTAYVVRKVVEMRVGPGTQFKLKDSLVSQGDRVVLLERNGSWQKVILPEKSEVGWVHRATLGRIELNTNPITLKCELLPRVFATKKLSRVFPYQRGSEREVKADIAKGESFIAVRYGG